MNINDVTPEMLAEYDAHMARQFNVMIVNKSDVPLMEAIGTGFEIARTLGAKLPTAKEWMENYWTMFGPLLVRPKKLPTDPLTRVRIMAHECQHGEQFHSGDKELAQIDKHVAFAWLYLTSQEARWRLELWAIRAEMEVHYALTGGFPSMADVSRMVEGGYALDAAYRPTHESAIASFGAQLQNDGLILTPAGRAAIQWCANNNIDIVGRVRT
jgi:hypothetical protein